MRKNASEKLLPCLPALVRLTAIPMPVSLPEATVFCSRQDLAAAGPWQKHVLILRVSGHFAVGILGMPVEVQWL